MAGLLERVRNFFLGEDMAVMGALGGAQRETLSGSIGRACGYTEFGKLRWWGRIAEAFVDGLPWFGEEHCRRQAEKEARRRLVDGASPSA